MPSPTATAEEELDELAEAGEQAAAENEEGGTATVVGDDGIEEALAEPVEGPGAGGGFFSGEDTLSEDSESSQTRESTESSEKAAGDIEEMVEGAEEPAKHSFEEPIVEGFARLAVVGLDDPEKDELEDEFVDVFEAFQLGHYGDRVLHEYILVGDDDVHPVWGLAGSMLLCTVLTLYMRPDGDEIISDARGRLAEIREGNT